MRLLALTASVALSASPIHAQSNGGTQNRIAEFQGHILPKDKDFRLQLLKDGAAGATWIGLAGRKNEFGGFYTVTGGTYEVSLKAKNAEQFYQTLNLSIRTDGAQPRGDWTSDRQKNKRSVAELRVVEPGTPESAPASGASRKSRKPVVAVIRTGTRARATSARQVASAQRVTQRTFRNASKRITRATRTTRRRR
jgi:hypothetical protein